MLIHHFYVILVYIHVWTHACSSLKNNDLINKNVIFNNTKTTMMLIKRRLPVDATNNGHGATPWCRMTLGKVKRHCTKYPSSTSDVWCTTDKTRMQVICHAVNASAEQNGHDMCLSEVQALTCRQN
jgi:hypothetical protein